MTLKFDEYIKSILKEGLESQGSGGISTRAPGIKSTSGITGGVNSKLNKNGGVNMKFSGSANPKSPQQVVLSDTPENDQLLDQTLDSAMQSGNNDAVTELLAQKMQQDPNYFQSDNFLKSPVKSKWAQNPNNQQLITQLTTGISK